MRITNINRYAKMFEILHGLMQLIGQTIVHLSVPLLETMRFYILMSQINMVMSNMNMSKINNGQLTL